MWYCLDCSEAAQPHNILGQPIKARVSDTVDYLSSTPTGDSWHTPQSNCGTALRTGPLAPDSVIDVIPDYIGVRLPTRGTVPIILDFETNLIGKD